MAGLGGGRAAMEKEYSAEELEVAEILVMLPQLMWGTDHGPPCTHNLLWGARKRRSAGADDDPPVAAPPPPRLPVQPPAAATKKLSKERCGAAAAAVPSGKEGRTEARQEGAEVPEESAAASASMGSSSPETPLDFCPSTEEADAKARAARACPADAGPHPAKKPKQKHEHLSEQVDQLNRTRTELQKEAAEIRKRLEALRERNSELVELRIKLEKEGKRQREEAAGQRLLHGRGCLDLLPTGPVLPAAAAHAPDRVHPQAQPPPPQQQQQQPKHAWPQHWVNNAVAFQQVAPGFSIHPTPAAAAGNQQWSWAGVQAWRVDGDGAGAGKVPDINSGADLDCASVSQQQYPQKQQHQLQQQKQGKYYYQQQQQHEQRRTTQEQRAARKQRIQMIQQRRNAAGAAAASGGSVKVAGFR